MNQATVDPAEPRHRTDHPPEPAATVVVGAGIGGLLAAITAADGSPGRRVVLVDPHPPGGRARTDQRAGFTFNRGPRALYRKGPADRALRAVGVDTGTGGPPSLRNAIAIHQGRVHRFPGLAHDAVRTSLLTTRQKAQVARTAAALWRPAPGEIDGRSLADWLDARGLDGVARQFAEALVRVASYANAPATFAAAPALANARAGISPGVRYLDGGWQSLVDQLLSIAADRGVDVVQAAVRRVVPGPTAIGVHADGRTWDAGSVVLALGGPDAAAAVLPERPPSWGDLGPPVTAACLELGIRGVPTHRFALGIDEPVYGSTHCPPAGLAPEGHAVVHLMRYQPVGDDLAMAEQRACLDRLARRMGIVPDAVVEARFLARMVVSSTLPHPRTGLGGRPPVEVAEHPGIFLAGDWVGPTGLLLDAVASSAVESGRRAAARSATMASA